MTNKNFYTILFFLAFTGMQFLAQAQTIDKLRLEFNKKEIVSKQVCMAVSKDSKYVAFAYENNIIKIVDLIKKRTLCKLVVDQSSIFDIRFNSSASHLICARKDKSVVVYDLSTFKESASFIVNNEITEIALSKINNYIAVGQVSGELVVYDFNKKEMVYVVKGNSPDVHISAIDFHPKQNVLAYSWVNPKNPFGAVSKNESPILPLTIYDLDKKEKLQRLGIWTQHSAILFSETGDSLLVTGLRTIGAPRFGKQPQTFVGYYDRNSDSLRIIYSYKYWSNAMVNHCFYLTSKLSLSVEDGNVFDVMSLDSNKLIYTTERDRYKFFEAKYFGSDHLKIHPLVDKKNFIINIFDNNICQIYNSESNEIVAFLFSDANDDFAVVSRDGRIEGDLNSIKNLYWTERKSSQKIYLESTFDQFYTPGLFKSLLSGIKLEKAEVNIENLKPLPLVNFIYPTVDTMVFRGTSKISLVTNKPDVPLDFNATDKGGGVAEIKIFQNGKLIYNKEEKFHGLNQSVNTKFNINLVTGENIIKIVAVNDDRMENSLSTLVKFNGETIEQPSLFVLGIGINDYEKTSYNLKYAVPDALGFTESIKEASKGMFSQTHITLLTNKEAVKTNVLNEVEKIKKLVKQGDVFVLYYAGHGTMISPKDGVKEVFHLVLHDVTNFYSPEMLSLKGISSNEIKNISKEISAQKQLFIFDACQSGGAVESLSSTRSGMISEKEMASLARSTGTYFLTASSSDQLASEFGTLGHGVFTYAVLQALSGLADAGSADAKISVKELSLYVENTVPELSEKYKGQSQHPVSYGYGQDFPLVFSNVYKMKTVSTGGKYASYSLQELEKMKVEAVKREDYIKANEIKEEIESRNKSK